MAIIRVAFEVNQGELFDTLAKMGGDTGPLGERLVSVLLTGVASWRDEVGMAVYGVKVWPPADGGDGPSESETE